ncbi:acyl-CoA dehydrogenase family protein [Nevskia sp.]|uniref:acyl-CoA dehydrogenase family protein n=1 Tax=Nevskia sp. TaxID=1929292 RepID=UPI0025F0C866|nr:acyl-CoA dehydrogenase family protein [Nevskia sp.]
MNDMTDFSPARTLLAAAQEMQPRLRERAMVAERERVVPRETIDELHKAGFFKLLVPRELGGYDGSYSDYVDITATLTRGCASTGWVYMIGGYLTGAAGAYLPFEGASEIFPAGTDVMCCGVNGPTATAKPTEGGYLVSGSWGFGSGSAHASWFLGGVMVTDEAGAVVNQGFVFFPMTQAKIKDTWHVTAMRGTGSNTVMVENLFVPAKRVAMLGDRLQREHQFHEGDSTVARMPFGAAFGVGLMGAVLGMAEAILDAVVADVKKKGITYWNFDKASDSATTLHKLGEAAMQIQTARLHVKRGCYDLEEITKTRTLTIAERARVRTDAAHAAQMCRTAADTLVNLAGASAFAETNPIQRYWRDLGLASRHAQLNTHLHYEVYGRAQCGMDPSISPFI